MIFKVSSNLQLCDLSLHARPAQNNIGEKKKNKNHKFKWAQMKFKTRFSLPLPILLNPVEEVWAGQLRQGCEGQPPQCSFLEAVPVQSSSCQSSPLILFFSEVA